MRIFGTIALFSIIVFPRTTSAGENIVLQLDFEGSAVSNLGISDSAQEPGPFNSLWTLPGVEQSIETFAAYTGFRRLPKSATPIIDCEKTFAGMWTSGFRMSEDHHLRRFARPSSLPLLNSHWLMGELWPLTQSYLDESFADGGPFSIVLAGKN